MDSERNNKPYGAESGGKMQAITCKYVGPSNTKGARVIVECDRGRMVVSYDDGARCPYTAAKDLLVTRFLAEDTAKYGTARNPWSDPMVMGTTKGGVRVFVFMQK